MNYDTWYKKYDKDLTWWAGCPHIQHKNICRATSSWDGGGTRDFNSLDEMNETVIGNICRLVPENGTIILLGDILFGDKTKFGYWMSRLRPRSILCVAGNHDDAIRKNEDYQNYVDYWGEYLEIRIGGQLICNSHYPMLVWRESHKGSWMVHSHCHGSLPDDPTQKRADLGVDTSYPQYGVVKKFEPYSFHDLQKIMNNKRWKQVDHHSEKTNP